MNSVEKIITIIIRLQALAFLLQAISHWVVIAIGIIEAALQPVPGRIANYETVLIFSIVYLVIAFILYIRSKSLAHYFIRGLENAEDSESKD
jgi:hypothetical protein